MNILPEHKRMWILGCLRAEIGIRETARRCHVAHQTVANYAREHGIETPKRTGMLGHHARRRARSATCRREGCGGLLEHRGSSYLTDDAYDEIGFEPVDMAAQVRTHCPACGDWSIWIDDEEIDGGPEVGEETDWYEQPRRGAESNGAGR